MFEIVNLIIGSIFLLGMSIFCFRHLSLTLKLTWPVNALGATMVTTMGVAFLVAFSVMIYWTASPDHRGPFAPDRERISSADELIALAHKPEADGTTVDVAGGDKHDGDAVAPREILSAVFGPGWANEPECIPAGPEAHICREGTDRLIIRRSELGSG